MAIGWSSDTIGVVLIRARPRSEDGPLVDVTGGGGGVVGPETPDPGGLEVGGTAVVDVLVAVEVVVLAGFAVLDVVVSRASTPARPASSPSRARTTSTPTTSKATADPTRTRTRVAMLGA
jgi:hypothetical protein